MIENPCDLRLDMYKGAQHIGITAGASTPKAIIEEVFVRMSETTKIEGIGVEEELDFAQAIEESMPVIRRNSRVVGTVTEVKPNEVIVDIGAKQTGVVPFDEFTDDSSANLSDLCKKAMRSHLLL